MRRIIREQTVIKPLTPKDISGMLRASRWWGMDGASRERCDMLETIQATRFSTLGQGHIVSLIRLCNIAIASYQVCTGYSKQWKHFKRKLIALLQPDTTMYVNGVDFKVRDALKFLKAIKICSDGYYRVLKDASTYSIRFELRKLYSNNMDISSSKLGKNYLKIGLEDRRIRSETVLKYCVTE